MRHFLYEEKEYRINPRYKRKRNEQDSAMALARLLRRLSPRSRSGSGSGHGGGARRGPDLRQKCIVKMQYSSSGIAHSKQLEEYLGREGTDIDGGRAKLYGTDLDEYRKNMVDKNFRIFLSPQSDKINLKEMTEKFMKTLEQRTGYKFYWQAANHYNTAHPHAHILINGKDKYGREVEIPRDIVRTFMREYARDICTSQIGNRTAGEIALEKERELEAQRFTRLDENIKDSCGGNFAIYPSQIYVNRERVLTRIENLRKMGLCSYKDGAYYFSPKWEDDLRANARYNTFLAARAELKYTDQANLKVFSGADGVVTGKVTKIYHPEDDFSNNHAVIIECPDGKAFFVPLLKAPKMIVKSGYEGKEKVELKEGELVSINTYATQHGRLTPVILKAKDVKTKQARKEIKARFAKQAETKPITLDEWASLIKKDMGL
jgi:hypothetical protein